MDKTTKLITIRVTENEYDQIERIAKEENRNKSNFIKNAVKIYIEQKGKYTI